MAGIYIHVPFCKTRCIYCDFYSTTLGGSRSKIFVDRLLEEASDRRSFLGDAPIRTLYLGGGTPSQLKTDQLSRLIEGLHSGFDLSQLEECTLEANPEDITPQYIQSLPREINRISMGVQSFVDDELRVLRRRHSAEKAREAVRLLQDSGIGNISIDLMYGLPLQSIDTFAYSIDQAIACGTQHISAYNLQVEEGTLLSQLVEQGEIQVAGDDTCVAMNGLLRRKLAEAGFEQYEISNYALPGYHSRHNSSYWDGTPYLGLGPGAHSYDGCRLRCWNEPDLTAYLEGNRQEGSEHLSDTDIYNERIMLGLRTSRGIEKRFVEDLSLISQLKSRGLILETGTHLRLTSEGLALADEVMRTLMKE